MKKKSFFNVFNAKMALSIVALSGALLTGCYKDDGLDADAPVGEIVLPEATYTLSGNVIAAETGNALEAVTVAVTPGTQIKNAAGVFVYSVAPGTVTIKATAEGYAPVTRTIEVTKINKGQSATYTQTIVMNKVAEATKAALYDVKVQAYGGKSLELLATNKYTATINAEPAIALKDGKFANVKAGEYKISFTENVEAGATKTLQDFTASISLSEVTVPESHKNIVVMVSGYMPAIDAPKDVTMLYADFTDMDGNYSNVQRAWVTKNGVKVESSVQSNINHFAFEVPTADVDMYVLKYAYLNDSQVQLEGTSPFSKGTTSLPIYLNLKASDGGVTVVPGEPTEIPGVEGEDKDQVTAATGTMVTLANGNVVRLEDVNVSIQRLAGQETEDATARVYEGTPSGIKFDKPLVITFKDMWAGQLGTMNLVYAKNNLWSTDSEGDVTLANGFYTMNVNHFSQFKAAVPYTATMNATTTEDTKVTIVGKKNDTNQPIEVTYKYKVADGSEFTPSISEAVAAAGFSDAAANMVVAIITDSLYKEGYTGTGITFEANEYKYQVAPYTCLEEFSATQEYKNVNYTFTVNGKAIAIAVKAATKATVNEPKIYTFGHGHGHSHGHGNNDLAGGGIIDAE